MKRDLTIGIDARAAVEEPAGRGRFVRELLRHLARRNDPSRYLAYARTAWDEPLDERFDWRLVSLGDPWWNMRVARQASRECDVFLSSNSYLTPWFTRVPTVVVVYDLVPFVKGAHVRRRPGMIERATIGPALRRAASLVCISRATESDLLERFPAARGKTHVVHLGVDERFGQQLEDSELERVRARHELERPFVLSVGTIEPRKNLTRVIEGYLALPAELRKSHLLALVGPLGWDFNQILQKASGIGDVRLLGQVSDRDLAALYQSCAVFCYPSLYEGFGLPLLEAMRSGAACITSNVSSLPEIGGDAVAYVQPTSAEDIRDALARLLTSEQERRCLGLRARERAASFSWERAAAELVDQFVAVGSRRRS
jgi:glycosyltransferase involved in cell wall biosynthesis